MTVLFTVMLLFCMIRICPCKLAHVTVTYIAQLIVVLTCKMHCDVM